MHVIADVLDVAAALVAAICQETRANPDQVLVGDVRRSRFAHVQPDTATFTVKTVEGKRFRVTVEQEPV